MRVVALILLIVSLQACDARKYNSQQQLSQTQYDSLLISLAPYVNKKPKGAAFSERFEPKYGQYYQACVQGQDARLPYYFIKDSLTYFYYVNKDLSSLYEHYKGYGGSFKKDAGGKIKELSIVFATPRLTKEEITEKGKELFIEMIETGSIEKYKGDRAYVHLPNADFEYNRAENRWVYTENSSWKFLKEIKDTEN
jgi:hypothetical protein